jgi:hypothetical protein
MQVDVQVYKVQALPPKTTPTAPVVNVVNNCDGTSTLTSGNTGTYITGESTASITVQTAATYTVTTTNASGCTSLQGSGVAAPKTTPTAPVVNVVNNCDGTSTLTASEYTGTLLWSTGESTASITVQAATYTVTTTNASGCTSLQGSGVAAPKTTPTAPVVNVVNNCDGTSTLTTGTLLWVVNQLLQ